MHPVTIGQLQGPGARPPAMNSLLLLEDRHPSSIFLEKCINASAITSKNGTGLPHEIWALILKDVEQSCSRFYPVELVRIQRNKDRSAFITCRRMVSDKEIETFCDLNDWTAVDQLKRLMMRTCRIVAELLDGDGLTAKPYGPEIRVPVYSLISSITSPRLYTDINVRDLISRAFNGHCFLCNRRRVLCPKCAVFGSNVAVFYYEEPGSKFACPLCAVQPGSSELDRLRLRSQGLVTNSYPYASMPQPTDRTTEHQLSEEDRREMMWKLGYEYEDPATAECACNDKMQLWRESYISGLPRTMYSTEGYGHETRLQD